MKRIWFTVQKDGKFLSAKRSARSNAWMNSPAPETFWTREGNAHQAAMNHGGKVVAMLIEMEPAD